MDNEINVNDEEAFTSDDYAIVIGIVLISAITGGVAVKLFQWTTKKFYESVDRNQEVKTKIDNELKKKTKKKD